MSGLIRTVDARMAASPQPRWLGCHGTQLYVRHRGARLNIRLHDVYFLNEHYWTTGKDFEHMKVDQEPHFDLILSARQGDLAAIKLLRERMNMVHGWDLYGGAPQELQQWPRGIPLDDAVDSYRAGDSNIIAACHRINLGANISKEYQRFVLEARSGSSDTIGNLHSINDTIIQFHTQPTEHDDESSSQYQ